MDDIAQSNRNYPKDARMVEYMQNNYVNHINKK